MLWVLKQSLEWRRKSTRRGIAGSLGPQFQFDKYSTAERRTPPLGTAPQFRGTRQSRITAQGRASSGDGPPAINRNKEPSH